MCLSDYIRCLALAMALLLAPCLVSSQTSNTFRKSSYVHNYCLDEKGYIVKCSQMSEDANGCIMSCTSSGLKIYNGRLWERFYNSTKSELISRVYVSPLHDIFVAGPECLGYYHPEVDGSLRFCPVEVPFSSRNVTNIFGCDSDSGRVVFMLDDGFAIYNKNIIQRSMGAIATSISYNGGIIILCKNGDLYSYFNGALQMVCNINGLGINTDGVKMLVLDNTRLFFLCKGYTAFETNLEELLLRKAISSKDLTPITLPTDNYPDIRVNDLVYNSRLRKLAIATNNGIYVYSNRYEYLQKIDKDINLPVNDIVNVFFDSKNNLWASYSGGVSRIELNAPFVFYSSNQGVSSAVLSSFVNSKYYYVGTVSSIFVSSHEVSGKNTTFYPIPYNVSQGQNFCWDLLGIDDVTLACTSEGLYQVFPDKAVHIAATGRSYGAAISPLYPGKLFVTGFEGFKVCDYSIKNGKISVSNVLSCEQITRPLFKIKIADDGAFWCSSLSDGIVRLIPMDDGLTKFDVEYISDNYGLIFGNQLTVELIDDMVYINDGLFKRAKLGEHATDPLIFEPDTALNKCFRPDEHIYHFGYSKLTDELFVYTQYSAWRINRSHPEINEIIHFRLPLQTVYNISVLDSLLLLSTNFGLVKGNITDTTSFNPAKEPFNSIINAVYFKGNRIYRGYRYFQPDDAERNYNTYTSDSYDENSTDTVCNFECEYYDNKIRIMFSSSAFENLESMMYCYKLEGIDNDWNEWSHSNVREFTKLPPGHYVFKVKARNCENVESSVSSFAFTIVPPFYASIWAILFYILIVAFLIYYLISSRTAKFKNKANDLSALLKQRNTQLEAQNEKLRQMSFVATRSTNSVTIMDKDGNIQWTNDSFKNVYGCSFDEFVYMHGRNYFESYLSFDKKNQELIQLARQSSQNVTYETCHRFYDNVNWVQASLDTVFDDNGNLCNWILTETDITMLKRAQEEGARQASQLTEAFMQLQENQLQIEMQKEQLFVKNTELEKGYKKIEVQNNAITNSLQYAQQMQQSILPLDESITQYFEHFAIYMPKDIVSGDFYWFEPLSDGSLIFVVADCTGHGVPGAFMSLIGYNLLNEVIIMQGITQPKLIFENLSQGLINVLKQERNQNYDGMEVRLCRFVPEDDHYIVTFCGTGSSIFYYNSQTDEMERIKGVHRHLGLTDESVEYNDFEEHQFVFNREDKLFMITDGLVDQNNPQRKRFGTERFMRFVTDYRSQSMDVIGQSLKSLLKDFMDGQPQRDDITVVGLSIKQ